MNTLDLEQLEKLFFESTGCPVEEVIQLPQAGSDRLYVRLKAKGQSIIGAYNSDVEENRAFYYLTRHFFDNGFPVAELIRVSEDEKCYLLTDLGDETLFSKLVCPMWDREKSLPTIILLKKSLKILADLQVNGAKGLDFSKCYPKSDFDLQSVMWDFNYFKYCFLKPSGIRFNETKLEADFLALANLLLSHKTNFFHYRDFQSRNIMLVNDEPYLIDYQGGRRGPLLYDAASFIYQAKANFPQWLRDELLEYYLESIKAFTQIDAKELNAHFPTFALFRVIQTLGAYGYRGFFERRAHFLQSIPLAASNLKYLLLQNTLKIPYLGSVLEEVSEKFGTQAEQKKEFEGLTIEIHSFSFKNGYPIGHPEHGGGFVFDCRALPNPGRLNEFKHLTGLDKPVADYLGERKEANLFFEKIHDIVADTIKVYIGRGFGHLSVAFGCTGGQHRSVYMANKLAENLIGSAGIKVLINHRELQE